MYDFSDFIDRDLKFFRQLPQFTNLSDQELNAILDKMASFDNTDWQQERDGKLKAEKAEDSRYMEEEGKKAPTLPDGDVKIERGLLITFATMDKNGFASSEDLARCKKSWKMSLEHDQTKKIYV